MYAHYKNSVPFQKVCCASMRVEEGCVSESIFYSQRPVKSAVYIYVAARLKARDHLLLPCQHIVEQ